MTSAEAGGGACLCLLGGSEYEVALFFSRVVKVEQAFQLLRARLLAL